MMSSLPKVPFSGIHIITLQYCFQNKKKSEERFRCIRVNDSRICNEKAAFANENA